MKHVFRNVVDGGKNMTFEMHDVDVSVVNALRRVIVAEVVTVAPHHNPMYPDDTDINILKNTTVLHDQIMGHRVSIVPVHLDRESIDNFSPRNYSFVIDRTNTTLEAMDITSEDIVVMDADGSPLKPAEKKKMFPPDPITGDYVLIARLKPRVMKAGVMLTEGDTFHCEFRVRRGTGQQHARWSPVSTCYFVNIVDEAEADRVLRDKTKKLLDGHDEEYTQGKMLQEELAKTREQHATLERQRCYLKNAKGEPSAFRFFIESECGLTAKDILLSAFDILINKLASLRSKMRVKPLSAASPSSSSFSPDVGELTMATTVVISLTGEDHTMGNLYQSLVYSRFIVGSSTKLSSIGYYVPHPLEQEVVFKLGFTDALADEQALWTFIDETVVDLDAHIRSIKSAF